MVGVGVGFSHIDWVGVLVGGVKTSFCSSLFRTCAFIYFPSAGFTNTWSSRLSELLHPFQSGTVGTIEIAASRSLNRQSQGFLHSYHAIRSYDAPLRPYTISISVYIMHTTKYLVNKVISARHID